jgi:hypothetical protein
VLSARANSEPSAEYETLPSNALAAGKESDASRAKSVISAQRAKANPPANANARASADHAIGVTGASPPRASTSLRPSERLPWPSLMGARTARPASAWRDHATPRPLGS